MSFSLLSLGIYTTVINIIIVGNAKVDIVYEKKQKVDDSNVVNVVIPDSINSVLSFEVSPNPLTQYKNADNFNVDTNELLLLKATSYDKYKNKIPFIPSDTDDVNPLSQEMI